MIMKKHVTSHHISMPRACEVAFLPERWMHQASEKGGTHRKAASITHLPVIKNKPEAMRTDGLHAQAGIQPRVHNSIKKTKIK
jgi:hypothetical protein